ncbi:MAG: 5'-3' exonuclease H3TH domain-containing protein [Tenuifilaceae bacterium]|nr:5'-3' exonuclease H3TH domain-containing protein [Tenuifilaceae bacterium]
MNNLFNSEEKKKYAVFDISFIIYNCSFAFCQKCDCGTGCDKCDGGKIFLKHNGEISGGLFGLFRQLFDRQEEGYSPIFVFDPPKQQLDRSQLIDNYKGNRQEKPEYIKRQMAISKELFSYTNVECFSSDVDESDDVISTIALERADSGHEVLVITDDKDMFPLLSHENINLYRQKSVFTKEDFKKKFGFCPSRFSEYLAIVGDAADNYNIIKGLGPKAASILINRYDHIRDLWDDWNNLENKYKNKLSYLNDSNDLILRKDELELSLKLAELNLKSEYYCLNKDIDYDKVKEMLDNIGIKSAINRIDRLIKR